MFKFDLTFYTLSLFYILYFYIVVFTCLACKLFLQYDFISAHLCQKHVCKFFLANKTDSSLSSLNSFLLYFKSLRHFRALWKRCSLNVPGSVYHGHLPSYCNVVEAFCLEDRNMCVAVDQTRLHWLLNKSLHVIITHKALTWGQSSRAFNTRCRHACECMYRAHTQFLFSVSIHSAFLSCNFWTSLIHA